MSMFYDAMDTSRVSKIFLKNMLCCSKPRGFGNSKSRGWATKRKAARCCLNNMCKSLVTGSGG